MALKDIGRTGQAMDFRNDARANPMAAMQAIRERQQAPVPMPVPAGPQVPTGGPLVPPRGGPMPVPTQAGPMGSPQTGPPVPTGGPPVPPTGGPMPPSTAGTQVPEAPPSLNDGLKKLGLIAAAVLGEKATKGSEIKKGLDEQERMARQAPSLQDMGGGALGFNPRMATAADGGLIGMAAGGEFMGRVPGDGHGMEDNVYMPIREGSEEIGTLAVSPSEYVVDSYTMAALGNGNADEGADIMDEVVEGVRERAYGNRKQPNEINGLAALRPMLERV